jgi:hypothetical protein
MFKTCSCMGSQAKAMPDQCLGATTCARRHEALTSRHAEHALCIVARSGGARHPARTPGLKEARPNFSLPFVFEFFEFRVASLARGSEPLRICL